MGDNYSPLQRNTLDGLSEMSGILYLKLLDVFEAHKSSENERRAFLAACDFEDHCASTLDYILRHAPLEFDINPKLFTELSMFFSQRWQHNFMGDGRKINV